MIQQPFLTPSTILNNINNNNNNNKMQKVETTTTIPARPVEQPVMNIIKKRPADLYFWVERNRDKELKYPKYNHTNAHFK
ncbi:hypothetical protein DFA_08516 [Cavenderia fasciculata]|uniref:Uncharacterized protein n=1 Tax=Cavenderia fasciculata TaxID=261658 RepID=F4Q2Q3_CACFS|nr:uncharacterized protein DFA_08516 [Cavenderia fasciculata]EGG17520.1 hypothetical protein DFA_08516 [Cavenderia fasciculata]|eukprot:XP_004356004.1 hypothetical protein DFA_08516 [Cavenderia fasciculata]